MLCAKGRGRKHLGLATSGNTRPNSGHREKASGLLREESPLFRGISSVEARSPGLRSARDWFAGTAKERLLQHRLRPVFQRFLHLVQELVGDRAVHHATVVAESYVAHSTD